MPSSSDPLKPTVVGKAVPKGPRPLLDAPVSPTRTVTALAKPSRLMPRTEVSTSGGTPAGFASHSISVGIPRDQGVGHFLPTPGGMPEKKSHAPAEGGVKTPSASPSVKADRRALLASIVEQRAKQKRQAMLDLIQKRASETPSVPPAPFGSPPKAASSPEPGHSWPKAYPRSTGPLGEHNRIHRAPTKLFGEVSIHEAKGPRMAYAVYMPKGDPTGHARRTAEAVGGKAFNDQIVVFDLPRHAREFADSLAIDPKKNRKVVEDEFGKPKLVEDDLDHSDEFDLGGAPSETSSAKATSIRKGISRARKSSASAGTAPSAPAPSSGPSAAATMEPPPNLPAGASPSSTTTAGRLAASSASGTSSPKAKRSRKSAPSAAGAAEQGRDGSSAKAATKRPSTSSGAPTAKEPERRRAEPSSPSEPSTPPAPAAPSPAPTATATASTGSQTAPTPTPASPAPAAGAKGSGTRRRKPAPSATASASPASTPKDPSTGAPTAKAGESTEPTKLDRVLARKHLNNTVHWKVSVKKHHNSSPSLAHAVHWAIKDAASGGSPDLGQAGPYTLQADVHEGKIKGIYLKLRDGRYKVPLDKPAEDDKVSSQHILDAIKRTMRQLAENDE